MFSEKDILKVFRSQIYTVSVKPQDRGLFQTQCFLIHRPEERKWFIEAVSICHEQISRIVKIAKSWPVSGGWAREGVTVWNVTRSSTSMRRLLPSHRQGLPHVCGLPWCHSSRSGTPQLLYCLLPARSLTMGSMSLSSVSYFFTTPLLKDNHSHAIKFAF